MKSALETLGMEVTEEKVVRMIAESGLKYDKWIDFEEFCHVLEPLPDEISSRSNLSFLD